MAHSPTSQDSPFADRRRSSRHHCLVVDNGRFGREPRFEARRSEPKPLALFAVILALGILYAVIGVATLTLVLLHSGKGGGLSDMFGGGLSGAAAGSTQMERNLDRLTVLFGLIFGILTLVLAFVINA